MLAAAGSLVRGCMSRSSTVMFVDPGLFEPKVSFYLSSGDLALVVGVKEWEPGFRQWVLVMSRDRFGWQQQVNLKVVDL